MGDSSNFHVGPRRLSKPRTNKSSSNLHGEQPTTPSSPHNSSDQDYFGGDAVVVNSHGERRSRSKSRGRIRAYLYGSSHDAIQNSSDDEEAQTGIVGAARDVKKRLSRTGSSITTLQSARASATRLSNSSSSGLLSVRSTESQKMDHEESTMIADQIKQRAYHDSLAAQNHVSTPVDEDRHFDSYMAPLRRKSLYTPGIATRNASDILRKPPKPSTDHGYYYDPSRSETSPLSHLAALNVGEDGRSTPCNLHYSQLGGLQLGTLRITNGAGSPVPGNYPPDAYRSATPESRTHDEYYTASEGSVTGDADHATPLPPRGGSPLKNESELKAGMQTDNQVPSSPDKSLAFERESSNESFPFSRETAGQAARARSRTGTPSDILRLEGGTLTQSFSFERASSKTCPIEATKSNLFLPAERETPSIPFSIENKLRDEIENLEGETSKESFSFEMRQSKTCRVEGRRPNESFPSQSETADELVRFEGETLGKLFPIKTRSSKACSIEGKTPDKCFSTGGHSPNGTSDIADEYIAELDGSPFSYPSPGDKRHIIPQSQRPADEMWRPFINNAKMQHAGNCGGSREDALRKLTFNANLPPTWRPNRLLVPSSQPLRYSASPEMFQADSGYCSYASLTGTPAHEVSFESEGNSIPSTKVPASSPPQAVETVRSSARSSFRIPVRKLRKQRPKSQPPPVDFISVKQCHELTDVHIPRVPSIIAARHADRLAQFPVLEHTFQSSQHTTADRTWSATKPHHELIRFPSPANALEAASAPLRSPPTASVKQRASTIVDKEDEWGASDLVRSPSWSEFGGSRRKKEQKKLAKEEKKLEKRVQKEKEDNKQRCARSRSASRTRASRQQDPLVTIADFGTVTESLGNSPYDIATAMSKPPNTSPIASNSHPHQMSTAMPRPKSMFGMDEADATDFARAHSRNRSQSFGRPSIEQAVRISTSCDNHDPQVARGAGTKDKAFGMQSALPCLSTADLTSSDTISSTKPPRPATKTAKPLDILPGMPQWISGERHRDFCGGSRPQSLFINAPSVPALAAVDLRAHDINWARDRQRSQSFSTAGAEGFDDRGGSPRNSARLHSNDTPPVPALPSIHQVKQREAEIIRSRPHSMIVEAPVPTTTTGEIDQRKVIPHPPEPGKNATPRKTKGSKIVPDLWSNESLEGKNPKTVERSGQASNHLTRESEEALPAKDNLWETQSYAWSQRRKSAGEALLRNQIRDVFDNQEAAKPAPLYEDSNWPSSLATAFTSEACQSFTPTPSHLGPFPNPLALHPQLSVQQPTHTSSTPALHHQSSTQQRQLPGFNPLASPHRPSVFSFQHENEIPISFPRRTQTQSFQIPRKRIGSSPSILRTENAIGSGRYERVLV